ncbi:hypothetical protein [uncultured Parvibaculum sp.]|uniref:hypothetical protein n=1 Tax=uncultured Parvibaculum sp. TaxID=291828 RepID=UPI0030D88C55|tara:strand:+ start:29173 stop:29616 length:444 start_codon:yes stop_codon:yes gene_type:complete
MTNPTAEDDAPAFSGDIDAQASITVNRKGGSLTAILKKILADKIGLRGNRLSAATVDIGSGHSVLLMMGARVASGHVKVLRSGKNRVELVATNDDEVEIDDVTEAFLNLKIAQFKKGGLNLTGPVSPEDWKARSEQAFASATKAQET